jgi:hypothetical protein
MTSTAYRPRWLNWWLQEVLADFYAARQQWDDECEAYSKGYATEAREFAERNPRPRLADFLRDHAYTARGWDNISIRPAAASARGHRGPIASVRQHPHPNVGGGLL